VYFSQTTNALALRRDILDRAMPGRDLKMLSMMQTCLETLGLQGGEPSLFDRIRSAIRVRLPDGYPTLDQIAGELRVSAASVQRSLSEQGLTYKDAVEAMRRNLARMYLDQRQLPLTEVALLLGYSELSAFTRAFTRWTGLSPRAYRQSLIKH
jgi:AraC-like DNA-binding protein